LQTPEYLDLIPDTLEQYGEDIIDLSVLLQEVVLQYHFLKEREVYFLLIFTQDLLYLSFHNFWSMKQMINTLSFLVAISVILGMIYIIAEKVRE